MIYYTVYKITNLINGKIYIGAHKTSNLDDGYMGSGKIIKRAIEKYGMENFEKKILEIFESSEEMYEMESKLVTKDFIEDDSNYNLKEGGYGGFDYLNKTGLNMKNHNYKDISLLGNARYKHLFEYDTLFREKQRTNAKIALKKANKVRKEMFPNGTFFGKKHTYEAKMKMSEFQKQNQKGEKNSQFGMIWIYNLNLKKSQTIPKGDLKLWEADGWIKGRKLSFELKPIKVKLCKKCGSEKCERPEVCSKNQMINTLSNFFTFDKDTFGSTKVYEEFDRVVKLIEYEYHTNKLSTIQIVEKYNFTSTQRLDSVFKSLGIKPRTKSEALKNFTNKNKSS